MSPRAPPRKRASPRDEDVRELEVNRSESSWAAGSRPGDAVHAGDAPRATTQAGPTSAAASKSAPPGVTTGIAGPALVSIRLRACRPSGRPGKEPFSLS